MSRMNDEAVQAQQNRINRLMIREADRVAKGAGCGTIMAVSYTHLTLPTTERV